MRTRRHLRRLALLALCSALSIHSAHAFNGDLVREREAKLIKPDYVKATGGKSIVQGWKVPEEQIDDALEYLNKYVSTKNTTASDTVTIARGEYGDHAWFGTYVLVRVYYDKQFDMVIRELRLVNAVSTLAGLAALDYVKTRDNEILDLFGLHDGEGDHVAFVWRNLTTASETYCMDTLSDANLVTQFASGWTYAGRQWKEEEDGSATFMIAFRKVAWPDTWAANRYQMGASSTGGFAWVETHAVAGVHSTNHATLLAAIVAPTNGFVLKNAQISEGADGSLRGTRRQAVVYTGATANDATITFWREADDSTSRLLVREWPRRTETVKDALVGSNGVARSSLITAWPGETANSTNAHKAVRVLDHGDGSFTVRQTLEDEDTDATLTDHETRWSVHYTNRVVHTRSTDNKIKVLEYLRKTERHVTSKSAMEAIQADQPHVIRGSESVRYVGKHQYEATWSKLLIINDWGPNTYVTP